MQVWSSPGVPACIKHAINASYSHFHHSLCKQQSWHRPIVCCCPQMPWLCEAAGAPRLESGTSRTRPGSPATDMLSFISRHGTVASSRNDLDMAGKTPGAVQWDGIEFQLITFKPCDHRQVTSPHSASSFLLSWSGILHYLNPGRWKH